jgi:hypothetical protein
MFNRSVTAVLFFKIALTDECTDRRRTVSGFTSKSATNRNRFFRFIGGTTNQYTHAGSEVKVSNAMHLDIA